jgi:hypothetical protein
VIERTRKRPRDKSVTFRTFWWLLTREAVLNICQNSSPNLCRDNLRAWLARSQTHRVRFFGENLIRGDRGRRFWP